MSIYHGPDSILETKTVEIENSFLGSHSLVGSKQIQHKASPEGLDRKLLRKLLELRKGIAKPSLRSPREGDT